MSVRKPVTDRTREVKNYSVYCVNFHGCPLKTIRNEFKLRVRNGLRRNIFLIDLTELQNEIDQQPRTSKQLKDYMDNSNEYLIAAILQKIQDYRKEYDEITKQIIDELKFDLYQYWLKDIEEKMVHSQADTVSLKRKMSAATKARRELKTLKGGKKKNSIRPSQIDSIACIPLEKREHNRVGQKEMVSKRKYVKDDPADGKLSFIILGFMPTHFYEDLMRRDQPLQGIINFVPIESNYDKLVNNVELRQSIQNFASAINSIIYQMRQMVLIKPVGIFTYDLPIISDCLARKYHKEIYDQLSWCLYDVEMLQQQYLNYYFRPFQETDVQLPQDADLTVSYNYATTLCMQGHFQKKTLCGSGSDVATIFAYLDSLLDTCGLPDGMLSEKEIILLSMTDYKLPKYNTIINQLIKLYRSAFVSITKIRKFNRLFVEDGNRMMVNMLQYAEQNKFKNLYLACLDYNLWRSYGSTCHVSKTMENTDHVSEFPPFAKFYSCDESCQQRLVAMEKKCNEFFVEELRPNYKHYTFRFVYNSICEHEQLNTIPTRLCFRDFSLFQMEEFLENLRLPEVSSTTRLPTQRSSDVMRRRSKNVEIEENIYIRLNSLKYKKRSMERMSEVQSQTLREKEQRSSRRRSSQLEKKSSARNSAEWVGLPPNHHLIKGYNLENIRQEIKTKTSQYLFHNGCLELYEEKWCFQDTNKTLKFKLEDYTLYFNRPRSTDKGMSNNIRVNSPNNIDMRILNESGECAKIVLTYPNGLIIYYHEIYCVQMCLGDPLFQNETKRIYTPYGAIVVFYEGNFYIKIMRYNGEIYILYQYEFPEEEEEQEMLSQFSNNRSYDVIDNKAQGDVEKPQPDDKKQKTEGSVNLNRGQGDTSKKNVAKKLEEKPIQISEDSVKLPTPRSQSDFLKDSVEFELSFLNFIMSVYSLSYVNLKITTSLGRRIKTKYGEKMTESLPLSVDEWHDYYANESYAMRSDGVKMIWSQDMMKCYFKDGTLLTTKIEEAFDIVDMDEYDMQISQSSSHLDFEYEEEEAMNIRRKSSLKTNQQDKPLDCSKYEKFILPGEGEEVKDTRYISYSCANWLIQHSKYAAVYFIWTTVLCPPQSSVNMEILANDNIAVYTTRPEEGLKEFPFETILENISEEEEKIQKILINVRLGKNLYLTVDQEGLEIYTVMQRLKQEKDDEIMSDSLTLKILFKDSITDVFQYLIKQIATFQNCDGPITKDIHFVEILGEDCKKRGFEFLHSIEQKSQYHTWCGNCWVEVQPLKEINEVLAHSIDSFEKDMEKFPRFPFPKPKHEEQEFPMVSLASIICHIPAALQNSCNICSFLKPFERINFKTLRRKFKNLLDIYLRPKIKLDLKILYSTNNWSRRRREHERRKFLETQRKGLYHAMLKHNKYPNYFKFMQSYRGNVSDIDFFEFMQCKCKNIDVPRREVYWKKGHDWIGIKSLPGRKPTGNPECLYGTYDK